MKLKPTYITGTCSPKHRWGFTLAEVLAALAFMAIVIPVAMEGVQVANRAGQVGQRKMLAARIAERTLNEAVVTGSWETSTASQEIQDGPYSFRYTIKAESWERDSMMMISSEVIFTVQGEEYHVNLSTLVDSTQAMP